MAGSVSPDEFVTPGRGFFVDSDCTALARSLLGCLLLHRDGDGIRSGIIVETEAYTQDEEACHAHRGRTRRNSPMFEEGGRAYVYMVYGIHNCFNVTSGPEDRAEAVLVRALEPLTGIDLMRRDYDTARSLEDLCRGPGRLCRSMGISRDHNGLDLVGGDVLAIRMPGTPARHQTGRSRRIGISRARDLQWRFYLAGSPFVSSSSGRSS